MEPMYVAGIDLSSFQIDIVKLPVANADDTSDEIDSIYGPKITSYSLGKKGTAFDRARLVRDAVPDRYAPIWSDVLAIGIEEPFGKGHLSTAAGYRVQGAVLACLPPATLVQPWAPASWKKAVGIGGGADKEKVAAWVMRQENKQRRSYGMTQDAADAYCVAWATREVYSIFHVEAE